MKNHLQDQDLDAWTAATDTEIVAALETMPQHPDPCFMTYCKRYRPSCLLTHLRLHEAKGGYIGSPARKLIGS